MVCRLEEMAVSRELRGPCRKGSTELGAAGGSWEARALSALGSFLKFSVLMTASLHFCQNFTPSDEFSCYQPVHLHYFVLVPMSAFIVSAVIHRHYLSNFIKKPMFFFLINCTC